VMDGQCHGGVLAPVADYISQWSMVPIYLQMVIPY